MATIRQGLRTAGNRRSKARAEVLRQSDLIKQLAPLALAEGMTKREIADLAQISRPALDSMLNQAERGSFYGRLFDKDMTPDQRRAVLDEALTGGASRDELEKIERRLKDQGDLPDMDI